MVVIIKKARSPWSWCFFEFRNNYFS